MIKNCVYVTMWIFVLPLSGIFCNKIESVAIQVEIGSALATNKRKYMQDAIDILNVNKGPAFLLLLCDGHDKQGKEAAEMAIKSIAIDYLSNQSKLLKDTILVNNFFQEAFSKADMDIQKSYTKGGTTALAVYMHVADYGVGAYMAWAGDSRALFVNTKDKVKAVTTIDHKPDIPSEKERIAKIGGIQPMQKSENDVWRINGLAVSRALGDQNYKKKAKAITAEPELNKIFIPKQDMQDTILVMASDGIWDVFTNSHMIDFVTKNRAQSANDLAKLIEQQAIAEGSTDNISVIVAKFAVSN